MSPETVERLVDDLFRRQWGQLVATLNRILGDLDFAEEVVQEALLKALRIWPYRGVPDNPRAWLITAARNRALDLLRHHSVHRRCEAEVGRVFEALSARKTGLPETDSVVDDQLQLLFLCCHPAIAPEAQVPLTLKLLGGFSNDEIARALLIRPATAAQRIVRAKRLLRSRGPDFELTTERIRERRRVVLKTLYLMFNEGYAASGGDRLVRADICREAIRLMTLLADHPESRAPEADALLSLMLLQGARFGQRCDSTGGLARLDDQDRSGWDPATIREGFERLERAARGPEETEYHIQAAIAAEHAAAADCEATNWTRIVALYDRLLDTTGSPLVALNRAVAVARLHGPATALPIVEGLLDAPELQTYYLLPATHGELLFELGRSEEAANSFAAALELPCSRPERQFLRSRLETARS